MTNLAKVLLVYAFQIILLGTSFRLDAPSSYSLSTGIVIAAFILPLPGYIIALYRAPMRIASSTWGRLGVLIPLSFLVTFLGGAFAVVSMLLFHRLLHR